MLFGRRFTRWSGASAQDGNWAEVGPTNAWRGSSSLSLLGITSDIHGRAWRCKLKKLSFLNFKMFYDGKYWRLMYIGKTTFLFMDSHIYLFTLDDFLLLKTSHQHKKPHRPPPSSILCTLCKKFPSINFIFLCSVNDLRVPLFCLYVVVFFLFVWSFHLYLTWILCDRNECLRLFPV